MAFRNNCKVFASRSGRNRTATNITPHNTSVAGRPELENWKFQRNQKMANRMLGLIMGGLLLAAGNTNAEAARLRYWGGMVITAQSGTCPNGNEVGVKFATRFTTESASLASTLSLFRGENAYNFRVNGRFTSAYKVAEAVAIHDFGGDPGNAVKVRFSSQSPATIAATTNFINVTGQISGWDEGPACTVTFRMSLTKRVE
jgi:hypothetical protein